jgi:integrase
MAGRSIRTGRARLSSDTSVKPICPASPPHGLRHIHATLALSSGVNPRIVSGRLGHSTVALTLDIYSHVLPQADAEAADRIAALIER